MKIKFEYTPSGNIEYGQYSMWIGFDLSIAGVKLENIGECIISVLDTSDHLFPEDINSITSGLQTTGKLADKYKYVVEQDDKDTLLKDIWELNPTFRSEEGDILCLHEIEYLLYHTENPDDSLLVQQMFTGGKVTLIHTWDDSGKIADPPETIT